MITRKHEQPTTYREQMRGGDGTVELTALSKELPKNARLFSVITLHPGTSIGYHVHENETEMFYFVSGQGCVHDDEEELFVFPGDCMSTPNGHGHSVACVGEEDLVMVAVIVRD